MAVLLPRVGAVDLANYILAVQGPMSHLKLQKLVYYVDAWHLVFHDSALVPEDFKAWVHGPVCLSLWHAAKEFSTLNGDIRIKPDRKEAVIRDFEPRLSTDQVALIKDVLKEYGSKPAHHLEALTHSEKPWLEARGGLLTHEPSSTKIKKTTMKDFYRSKLK
jgi:uncharacterized phage-associated protein